MLAFSNSARNLSFAILGAVVVATVMDIAENVLVLMATNPPAFPRRLHDEFWIVVPAAVATVKWCALIVALCAVPAAIFAVWRLVVSYISRRGAPQRRQGMVGQGAQPSGGRAEGRPGRRRKRLAPGLLRARRRRSRRRERRHGRGNAENTQRPVPVGRRNSVGLRGDGCDADLVPSARRRRTETVGRRTPARRFRLRHLGLRWRRHSGRASHGDPAGGPRRRGRGERPKAHPRRPIQSGLTGIRVPSQAIQLHRHGSTRRSSRPTPRWGGGLRSGRARCARTRRSRCHPRCPHPRACSSKPTATAADRTRRLRADGYRSQNRPRDLFWSPSTSDHSPDA